MKNAEKRSGLSTVEIIVPISHACRVISYSYAEMKSLQLAAANLALSLLCISQAVYAQDNTGLKAYTAKGCYSSSSPLEDQGPYLYQTPGYCQKTCVNLNKPVMGLIAGSNCWCGDLVPAANSKVSDSECNTNCQGFPADKCMI